MTTQGILLGCQRQVQVELLEKLVINYIPLILQEDKLKKSFCQHQNINAVFYMYSRHIIS